MSYFSEYHLRKLMYKEQIENVVKTYLTKDRHYKDRVTKAAVDLIQALSEEMYELFPEEKIMTEAYNTIGIPEGFTVVQYQTIKVRPINSKNKKERIKVFVVIQNPLIRR